MDNKLVKAIELAKAAGQKKGIKWQMSYGSEDEIGSPEERYRAISYKIARVPTEDGGEGESYKLRVGEGHVPGGYKLHSSHASLEDAKLAALNHLYDSGKEQAPAPKLEVGPPLPKKSIMEREAVYSNEPSEENFFSNRSNRTVSR